jgi:signal transduction histidine kinase/ActR/RegA family two-component response regulator
MKTRSVPAGSLDTLTGASQEILSETSVDGLLARVAHWAKKLTRASACVAGHGFSGGAFLAAATAQEGRPADPLLPESLAGLGSGLLAEASQAVLRLPDQALPPDEAWWGPGKGPLRGLLAIRLETAPGPSPGLIALAGKAGEGFGAADEVLLSLLAAMASLGLRHLEAQEAAKRADRAKRGFLAKISHEIRTPLNGIIGMTELALRAQPLGKIEKYLRLAHKASKDMLRIVNDIMDLARIEAGKVDLEQCLFAPRQVLHACLAPLAVLAGEKGLGFEQEVDPEVPHWLVGDPGRLGQILSNLAANAVKFTAQGQVKVKVSPGDEAGPGRRRLLFAVSDTGPGIARDQLDTVFQSFTQVGPSGPERSAGSGLGLAIARELAESMGGRMWAESTPGTGSAFYFTAVFEAAKPGGRLVRRPKSGESREGQRRSVLLAEENPVDREVIREILTSLGYTATVVSDGLAALAALGSGGFDAVLLDVVLPGLSGLEATAAIRSGQAGAARAGVPILAISTTTRPSDQELFMRAGMDGYVSKPVDYDELRSALKLALAGNGEE